MKKIIKISVSTCIILIYMFSSQSFSQVEVFEDNNSDNPVFMSVEEYPEFPGGDSARIDFIRKNIVYPQKALASNVQGTIYITFVVEKDGKLTNEKILRGIGAGCDEEALRVISIMPRWKPGKVNGKPVRVQFNLPIKFAIPEKKVDK